MDNLYSEIESGEWAGIIALGESEATFQYEECDNDVFYPGGYEKLRDFHEKFFGNYPCLPLNMTQEEAEKFVNNAIDEVIQEIAQAGFGSSSCIEYWLSVFSPLSENKGKKLLTLLLENRKERNNARVSVLFPDDKDIVTVHGLDNIAYDRYIEYIEAYRNKNAKSNNSKYLGV